MSLAVALAFTVMLPPSPTLIAVPFMMSAVVTDSPEQ